MRLSKNGNPHLYRAKVRGSETVIVFYSHRERRLWIARDPENRAAVPHPKSTVYKRPLPALPAWVEKLPPMGVQVRGFTATGHAVIVFRRKTFMSWTWALHCTIGSNIAKRDIVRWEYLGENETLDPRKPPCPTF